MGGCPHVRARRSLAAPSATPSHVPLTDRHAAAARSKACTPGRSPSSIAQGRLLYAAGDPEDADVHAQRAEAAAGAAVRRRRRRRALRLHAAAGRAAVRQPFRRAAACGGRRRTCWQRAATRSSRPAMRHARAVLFRAARRGAAAAAVFAARAQLLGQAQRHARVLRRMRPCASTTTWPSTIRCSRRSAARSSAIHRRCRRNRWSPASTAVRRRTTRCRCPGSRSRSRGWPRRTSTREYGRAPKTLGRRDDRASGNGVGRAPQRPGA